MEKSIDQITKDVLLILSKMKRDEGARMSGHQLQIASGFRPRELNDAVAILEAAGLVDVRRGIANAPYQFETLSLTARGLYESDRLATGAAQRISHPPSPVGSPYGFQDIDWEIVAQRKAEYNTLFVCMGYQFHSAYYDTLTLSENTRRLFAEAVSTYQQQAGAHPLRLAFQPLEAGLGEHLFNEIARDIISADIAVFDTSDQNPNVMLEMGVALTWGIRVLPIKNVTSPKLPTDISGQTWVEYSDSGSDLLSGDNPRKTRRMVERAVRKKLRP